MYGCLFVCSDVPTRCRQLYLTIIEIAQVVVAAAAIIFVLRFPLMWSSYLSNNNVNPLFTSLWHWGGSEVSVRIVFFVAYQCVDTYVNIFFCDLGMIQKSIGNCVLGMNGQK